VQRSDLLGQVRPAHEWDDQQYHNHRPDPTVTNLTVTNLTDDGVHPG
jgi:hypothetical protein